MSATTLRPADIPSTARQQRENLARPELTALGHQSLAKPGIASHSHLGHYEPSQFNRSGQRLQVSPYTEFEHLLDLSTVDTPNRLLALALTTLEPSTPAYATTKYSETFNWPEVFATLRALADAEQFKFPKTEFYVIDGKTKLKEELDRDLLFSLDKQSHQEATASGGLLKYWFGTPDPQRRNLATCVWRSKDDAIKGGNGPWHRKARAILPQAYEYFTVHGLRLVIEEGVEGWKFEPFSPK